MFEGIPDIVDESEWKNRLKFCLLRVLFGIMQLSSEGIVDCISDSYSVIYKYFE